MENPTKIESDFIKMYELLGLNEETINKVIGIKRDMMESPGLKMLNMIEDTGVELYVMSMTHNSFMDRMLTRFQECKLKAN